MREEQGRQVRETVFGEPYDLLGRAVDALDEVANADSRQASPDVEEAEDASHSSASESRSRKRRGESLREDGDYEDSPSHKKQRTNTSHVEREGKETSEDDE
ncbi:hypothetical protein EJ03DRAFT_324169 [Teratosphaeria nubilosa]|uniref:Uncharacterized protein n=1 Tax=Teratosphaeria nubilosa TaxID=161662 RepID=A0A6G1LKM0_9PEZI|nr:hypothetical protein EJ03DRAFT_324169 [Teratosphaeria nubilosa]